MRYRFKLEALRRYRRFQEEAMHKELSDAQRSLEMEEQKLSSLEQMRSQRESELQQAQAQSATSPQLSIYSDYLRRISDDIDGQRLVLAKARTVCEEKRQTLILAMQKRKTLEKLKENGLKEYLHHLSQEEEKFINEMAISRFNLGSK